MSLYNNNSNDNVRYWTHHWSSNKEQGGSLKLVTTTRRNKSILSNKDTKRTIGEISLNNRKEIGSHLY